jgi:hypothetical protein
VPRSPSGSGSELGARPGWAAEGSGWNQMALPLPVVETPHSRALARTIPRPRPIVDSLTSGVMESRADCGLIGDPS